MDRSYHQSSIFPDPSVMDFINGRSRNSFPSWNAPNATNHYSDYQSNSPYGSQPKPNMSRSMSRDYSDYSNVLPMPMQSSSYNSNQNSQVTQNSSHHNYYSGANSGGSGSQYTPPVSDFKIGHFCAESTSSHDASSNNSYGSGTFSSSNSAIGNSNQSSRETGIIEKLLQTYGFIQCCERQARLFFHFSQFEGNTEHLRVGDPVEFEVTFDRRTGKPIASSVTKISPEVVLSEERVIGFVTTGLKSEHSGEQQGRITYENRGECFFLPYCQEDVEGYVTLKPGDKVSFQIATNQSGNLGARHVRLENLVAPVKYRGVVSSIKDSYGFIERADVVDEIHFDFSEAKNIPEGLKLGDDVEFLIKSKNGKEVATDMIKLPAGTVVFEDINAEDIKGQVLKAVEEMHEAKQEDPLTGRIRYRGKDRSAVEVKFGERDQKGDFTLRHGDWVQFNIATDRRDHLQKATNISLLDDSFLVSGEKREEGIVCLLKEGFGFVKCADRDARMHFSYEELLDPQSKISVNDEVQFTVVSDQSVQSPNRQRAIRIRKLVPGTVKFEVLVQEGLEGEVVQEPTVLPKSPSKTSGEDQVQPGVITYSVDGIKNSVNFYLQEDEKKPMVGDKVNFNIYLIKRTKERIATQIRVVSPIITSITPNSGPRQSLVGSGRTLDRGSTNLSTLQPPSLSSHFNVLSSPTSTLVNNFSTVTPDAEIAQPNFNGHSLETVNGTAKQEEAADDWKNGDGKKKESVEKDGKNKKEKTFTNGKDLSSVRNPATLRPGYIAALKESFGFIETQNHDKEIFFHFSNVEGDPSNLELGQEVVYTISSRRGPSGKLSAENVEILATGSLQTPKILGEVFEGTILRSMRSVNPDQDEYCGLVCVGKDDEKITKRHQFGITGLVNKKELLQPGDQVTFQLDEDGWAVNITAVRKKLIAVVEAVKGPYGFLNYETEEGKKLFFHQSEVKDGITLTPGDEIQFVIITNHKTGKSAACNISRLASNSSTCQRPDRLVSKLKSLNMDIGKPRIKVIRQPRGPDGTNGFKLERSV